MKVPEDLLLAADPTVWVFNPTTGWQAKTTIEVRQEVRAAITDWFAAHEMVEAGTFTITDDFRTFVDLTECGPQCPACNRECFDYPPICDASWEAAPLGQPCPVLAARKETT